MNKLIIVLVSLFVYNCHAHSNTVRDIRGPHHPRRADPIKHDHYTPHRSDGHEPAKITQDTQLLQDREHIAEDLGELHIDVKNMTDEELEFHYFKLHDFDNNTKLDGLEMLQAIRHVVHAENTSASDGDFIFYVELIDKVLDEDDLDKDGYLSYIEYVLGRQKDETEYQKALKTSTNNAIHQ